MNRRALMASFLAALAGSPTLACGDDSSDLFHGGVSCVADGVCQDGCIDDPDCPAGVATTGGNGGEAMVGGSGGGSFGGASGVTGGNSGMTGGSSGDTGGSQNTGGQVDEGGVPLASPGDETSVSEGYLNLGELRLLNNRWGSDDLGCNTSLRVYVNTDRTVGWDFNRGTCGGDATKPDFPEIEFGVHPFGAGSEFETSPPFSSTTLLPLQIRDISSASIVVDNMSISLGGAQSWNIVFEFWFSQRNPVTNANPGVFAEILGMWGWQAGRWPCDTSGSVSAGDRSYSLCHQVEDFGEGHWRYSQFRMAGGPSTSFSGRVDIKAFLDWAVSTRGYSSDLWVTRFEIGSEIDDNTSGTVTVNNVTFEVNGQSRSIELAE